MFRHKSLALAVRLFFVLILLSQTTSPALAAGQDKHDPTPTFTPTVNPTNTPSANACAFYPIAVSAQSLQGLSIGDTINNIYNGSQPGNFGWLTWAGSPSVPTLVASLTPPGNSSTYTNPNNPFDHTLSIGDWAQGKPGVSNSSSVRNALDQLETIDIDLPVWDTSTGNGSNTQYHVAAFVRVRLTDYQLPSQNRISARFLGYSCGSGTPTPTPTLTHTMTITKTLSPTGTLTATGTWTLTPTLYPTGTMTPILTLTPTFTPTYTVLPAPTLTSTNTITATVTNTVTSTPTDTATPTSPVTPTLYPTSTMTDTATPTLTNTATLTPSPTVTMTNTSTATATETQTSTATLTPTDTATLTPTNTATSTKSPTATLPSGISCIDWRDGGLQGWTQSPWTSAGAEIRQNGDGLYAYASDPGTYQTGIYFQLPTGGLHKLLFGGQRLTDVTVAQGANAPENAEPLAETLTANPDGSYSITAAYVEVRWQVTGPTDLTNESLFTSFCYADVTPTATRTLTITATLSAMPTPVVTSTPSLTPSPTETPTPSPTRLPACQIWDLARDFRIAPNQENPNRDSCGNPGVWSFMESANRALNPQTYTLMSNFDPNAAGIAGFNYWYANGGAPYLGLNTTANILTFGAATFPPGTIGAHPGPNNLSVIAWRSPVDGYISIAGGVSDNDPGNGDGIQWYMDRSASGAVGGPLQRLASGSYPNGGAQTFAQGGGAHLNSIAVGVGDVIYLAIDPNQNYFNDFTRVDFSINLVPTPTPTAIMTPTALPTNYALRFDPVAASKAVVYPAATNLNFGGDMTIEFWVRTTSNTGGNKWYDSSQWILDKDLNGEGNPDWAVVVNQGRIAFDNGNPDGSGGGGDQPLYSTPINDGAWHHIAIVRNVSTGNGLTVIYVDGAQNASGVFSAASLANAAALLIIGVQKQLGDVNVFSLRGDLDDLRLWNISRSQSDVQSDMFALAGGDEAGLMGYWPFNEGSGQIVYDQTQFHIDGRLGSSNDADDGDPLWTLASELFNGTPAPTPITPSPTGPTPTPTATVTATATVTPSPTPTATATASPTATQPQPLVIPGWIASPTEQSTISGLVPIKLIDDITLADGTIDYWPVDDTSQLKVLAEHVSGDGGAILASLDTTMLANDSYIIRLQGTDSDGAQQSSGVLVTVAGEFKPGRVRFTITDLTVPLAGLPIVIGRAYDSLERARSGDFGHGWSLSIGNPRLTVSQAKDVTLTLPNGKRVTFYFNPTGSAFLFLHPHYTPQPGVYGSLEVEDCALIVTGGKYYCFLQPGEYQPAQYTYTDPYGRKFVMDDGGTLQSITDLNGNVLGFTPDGIISNLGLSVPFVRDLQGRITKITDPEGNEYNYSYDAVGDLVSAGLPGVTLPLVYHYSAHFFLGAVDPRNHTFVTDTYYPDGRLKSEEDAIGNIFEYGYDLTTQTTTVTNPDLGTEVSTYDTYGKLLHQTDPLGHTTSFTYDTSHNLLTQTDGLGHKNTYTYDGNGHPTSIENSLHQISSTAYNQYGGIATEIDAMNNVLTVHYDNRFRPTSLSDSLGILSGFTWDDHGSILTHSDANGKVTTKTYDPFGNLLTITNPLTHTTTYTYDKMGRKTSVTDAAGHTTQLEYDPLGHLTKISEPLGKITHYEYDPNGNRTAVIDSMGQRTSYMYNDANQLIMITAPDLSTRSYTYNWHGKALTETDQSGHITRYEYDLAGQLLHVTSAYGTADAGTMNYGYDAAGRSISVTDPLNHTTTYTYDDANRLIKTTDAFGHSTQYAYDANGRSTSTTDANNHQTHFTIDARGRITLTTFADTTTRQQTYNGNGQILTATDQGNKTTSYTYDDAGELLSVTDPLLHTTSYAYDPAGNLAMITDANTHQIRFAYDALNRQTQKTWPDQSFEALGYDLNDNQTSHRLADGQTNTYGYDSLNRLTHIHYFDSEDVNFTYTPNGQRETAVDSRGTTRYAYDNRDNLTAITQPNGQTIQYSYDLGGKRLNMTTPAGLIQYSYDVANRLASVNDPSHGLYSYNYDDAGLRTQLTLPNGIAIDYSYDALNRLTSINQHKGATILASYAYTLDPAGNRLNMTEADGFSTQWTYDNAYRLTSETRRNASNVITSQSGFTYDPVGNRLSQTIDAVTTNYTYNNLDQLLIAGTSQYQYDGRGNLAMVTAGANITHYTYNAADHLTSAVLPGGASIAYAYDADGRRVQRANGTQTTSYLWDEASPYGDVVSETDGANTTSYVLGGTQLLSQTRNTTASYYLPDGLGSTRALADGNGNITDTYRYSAFGELQNRTGTTLNNYLYTGQQLDVATGLYVLRARYYAPLSSRFLTRDIADLNLISPTEISRYGYVADNPINATDPSGYMAFIEYAKTHQEVVENESPAMAETGSLTEGQIIKAKVAQEIASSGQSMDLLNRSASAASRLIRCSVCLPVALRTALELQDKLRAILNIQFGGVQHEVVVVLEAGEVYVADNTLTSGSMYGNGISLLQYLVNIAALHGQKITIEVWPYARLAEAMRHWLDITP